MIETVMNEINNETASLCLMNESLKKHTTYGIGGPADLMIFPKSHQALNKVNEFINENKIQTGISIVNIDFITLKYFLFTFKYLLGYDNYFSHCMTVLDLSLIHI